MLPEFVEIDGISFEIIVVSRVEWLGVEYKYRVCHATNRIFLSKAIQPCFRRVVLNQIQSEIAAVLSHQWLAVA